jgi:hypothetical protein
MPRLASPLRSFFLAPLIAALLVPPASHAQIEPETPEDASPTRLADEEEEAPPARVSDEEDTTSRRRRSRDVEDEERDSTSRRRARDDDEDLDRPRSRRTRAEEDDERPVRRRSRSFDDEDTSTRSRRSALEDEEEDTSTRSRRSALEAEDDEEAPRRSRSRRDALEEDEERPARRRRSNEEGASRRRRSSARSLDDDDELPSRRRFRDDDDALDEGDGDELETEKLYRADEADRGLSAMVVGGLMFLESSRGQLVETRFGWGLRASHALGRLFQPSWVREGIFADLTWLYAAQRSGPRSIYVDTNHHYFTLAPAYQYFFSRDVPLAIYGQLGAGLALQHSAVHMALLAADGTTRLPPVETSIGAARFLFQYGVGLRTVFLPSAESTWRVEVRVELTRFRRGYMDDTYLGLSAGAGF